MVNVGQLNMGRCSVLLFTTDRSNIRVAPTNSSIGHVWASGAGIRVLQDQKHISTQHVRLVVFLVVLESMVMDTEMVG